ncbi:unnamed protein product, partial [Mesorhabditis spiculigera]
MNGQPYQPVPTQHPLPVYTYDAPPPTISVPDEKEKAPVGIWAKWSGILIFLLLCAGAGVVIGKWGLKDPPLLPFFGERDYTLAEDGTLTEHLTISQSGQFIHVYCNATELADRFCLDLKSHGASKFKFCADFTNETDRGVHSFMEMLGKDGKTVNEETVNPFERNSTVDLRVRFTEKYVQVFGNQGELGIYDRPAGIEGELTATLSGDISGVRLFRVEGASYSCPFENNVHFERDDRLDLKLQPMMELRDDAQIREIFGDRGLQDVTGANIIRTKRKSSGHSGRGGSSSRSHGSSHGSGGGHSSHSVKWYSGSSSSKTYRSYHNRVHTRFGFSGRRRHRNRNRQGYYAYKSWRGRSATSVHPYAGPASFSYRYGGRTYFVPTTHCYHGCRDEFQGKTVEIPKPKSINITFSDETNTPTFIISLQFEKDSVWIDTWEKSFLTDGRWNPARAIKSDDMPIDDWRIFDLSIIYTWTDLEIYFNGERFVDFDHREHRPYLDKIRIEGDVEILDVTKNGKTL